LVLVGNTVLALIIAAAVLLLRKRISRRWVTVGLTLSVALVLIGFLAQPARDAGARRNTDVKSLSQMTGFLQQVARMQGT
jgi:hypothetical protein